VLESLLVCESPLVLESLLVLKTPLAIETLSQSILHIPSDSLLESVFTRVALGRATVKRIALE